MHLLRHAVFFLLLLAAAIPLAAQDDGLPPPALAQQRNWREARTKFDAARAREKDWNSPAVRRAVEGSAIASTKLDDWDQAIALATEYVEKTKGTFEEAIGQRFLAGIYFSGPHLGVRRAGKLLRGGSGQGDRLELYAENRSAAIRGYERARTLLAELAVAPGLAPNRARLIRAEQIGVNFDLASILLQDDYYRGSSWSLDRVLSWFKPYSAPVAKTRPTTNEGWTLPVSGNEPTIERIPLGGDGSPRYVETPSEYAQDISDAQKVLFLLAEIERLDDSPTHEDAAQARLRRAMIAGSFYGQDRMVDEERYPSADTAKRPPGLEQPWELAENETYLPIDGWLRIIALPPSESPLVLLREVTAKYPASRASGDAELAMARYLQSRQQFTAAKAIYERLATTRPPHPHRRQAADHLRALRLPEVALKESEAFSPGERPRLPFRFRNAARVELRAFRLDFAAAARAASQKRGAADASGEFLLKRDRWRSFARGEVARWTETVTEAGAHRVTEARATAPFTASGAYLVEATLPRSRSVSRALVIITDAAIVHKAAAGGDALFFLMDRRTGQALPGRPVLLTEQWLEGPANVPRSKQSTHTSDADGLVRYSTQAENSSASLWSDDARGNFAFIRDVNLHPTQGREISSKRGYVFFDRPLYRPGETVRFRLWMRERKNGLYTAPVAGERFRITLRSLNNEEASFDAVTDEAGGFTGEHSLPLTARLGPWTLSTNAEVQLDARFSVEEYRKPEFEVTVKGSGPLPRPGGKLKVKIAAHYYFGAPAAGAVVRYTVVRWDGSALRPGNGRMEWATEPGQTWDRLAYPWLKGRPEEADETISPKRRAPAEHPLLTEERRLGPDGTVEVEIDTTLVRATSDETTHVYTVRAQVRDSGRWPIETMESFVVAPAEFTPEVTTDGGWRPRGEPMPVSVRTLGPGTEPVAVAGEVIVSRVVFSGEGLKETKEEELGRWAARTGADGWLRVPWTAPDDGLFRVRFAARDSSGASAEASALLWSVGPDFDPRRFRFREMEIIPDRNVARAGDTARLLVVTPRENTRVLFCDDALDGKMRSWRFVLAASRVTVMEVPVRPEHDPQINVEATVVADGRLHARALALTVEPMQRPLAVTVKTDLAEYRPGASGRVRVEARDAEGRPARGEVAIRASDAALSALAGDFSLSLLDSFRAPPREHRLEGESSLGKAFAASGSVSNLNRYFPGGTASWDGNWELEPVGLRLTGPLAAGRGGGQADDGYSGRGDRRRARLDDPKGLQLRSSGEPNRVIVTGSYIPTSETYGPLAVASYTGATSTENDSNGGGPPPASPGAKAKMVPAPTSVRSNFAGTAVWLPRLLLGEDGTAEAPFTLPDSITRWNFQARTITPETAVGETSSDVTATKGVLVRLQSPRFFIERDEVVVSSIAHNYLATAQRVRGELSVPAELFEPLDAAAGATKGTEGNLVLSAEVEVPTGGEHRFDWPLRALKPGLAKVTAKALSAGESDAVLLSFPLLVHGIEKQLAQGGSYPPRDEGTREMRLEIPAEMDPAQTRLEISLTPSLAGVLVDALPYLAGYPYGCVEQTVSRFYPTAVVAGMLKKLGTDLETLGKQRRDPRREQQFGVSPVFDSAELTRMTEAGLKRIWEMQKGDGGWGWWSDDDSSLFQTAYVLQGLHTARAGGIKVNDYSYRQGFEYLANHIRRELDKPPRKRQLGDATTQVLVAYVFGLEGSPNAKERKWLASLHARRGELGNQGLALLALALHRAGMRSEAALALRNLVQFVERDDANETAWVRTPAQDWWRWFNNDIETNAWALRALVAIEPKGGLAPRLVKWLVNNRRGGSHWRSTRDTALAISAIAEYVQAAGEADPDFIATVRVDDGPPREIRVTKGGLFSAEEHLVLGGEELKPGPHTVTLTKTGRGALYYSASLRFFTKEQDIQPAGGDIAVERAYFRLVPKAGADAPPNDLAREKDEWDRVPLQPGDTVTSGDLVEVRLRLRAANDYDFLAFEDRKPAGLEPVEVRSGQRYAEGFCANVELHDASVVFFVALLEQGEHDLRYRLRAEAPGTFRAPPATGFAMYAPELRANSRTMRLSVKDR